MGIQIKPYASRIVTVTPNPALDKTLVIDEFVERGVVRVREVYQYPSGKGLNVSRAIARLGGKSIATGFLGGPIGRWIEEGLMAEGIECDFVFVKACTRTSTTIRCDKMGIEVHLVEPGEQVEHDEVEQLFEKLTMYAGEGCIFIFCGSLPPGISADFYRRCIECVQCRGAVALLDASGKPLSEALSSSPFLVKPNEEELSEALGIELQSDSQIVAAIERLLSLGIRCAIVSQGERGAICGCEDGFWRAVPPKVNIVNTIGSGDAMLGGIAYALWCGMGFEEALRLGVAAGTANVLVDGPCYFDRETVFEICRAVKLERIAV